jgi:hypothetical protein
VTQLSCEWEEDPGWKLEPCSASLAQAKNSEILRLVIPKDQRSRSLTVRLAKARPRDSG